MIIGIDPGETAGVAFMDSEYRLRYAYEYGVEQALTMFVGFTEFKEVDAIVVEDFRLFQGKQMAQTGSKFEAVQIIGAARLLARILSVPFITQSPQILRLTEMHMHWPRHAENSHIPDHLSAQLHLLHYAETQGISTTRLRKLNPDILHP